MTYKLKYFNIKGRGEDIRLIFTVAGVKFTDDRVKNEDWPAMMGGMSKYSTILLELSLAKHF